MAELEGDRTGLLRAREHDGEVPAHFRDGDARPRHEEPCRRRLREREGRGGRAASVLGARHHADDAQLFRRRGEEAGVPAVVGGAAAEDVVAQEQRDAGSTRVRIGAQGRQCRASAQV